MTSPLTGTREAFETKVAPAQATINALQGVVLPIVTQPLQDLIDFYYDFLRAEILAMEKQQ